MKKELDDKLCKDFPTICANRHKSMMQSCFAFGFECGDGWEPIIRRLLERLEPIAKQYLKDNPNLPCENCMCPKEDHYLHMTANPGKCLSVCKTSTHHLRRRFTNYKSGFIVRWFNKLYNKVVIGIADRMFFKYLTCWCEKYEAPTIKIDQIKEKFGTLRVYMNFYNDEVDKAIEVAELESSQTCEDCGKEGHMTNIHHWMRTLCDDCEKERMK